MKMSKQSINRETYGSSRRTFLQGSATVAGAAVVSSVLPRTLAQSEKKKRPNIVFFIRKGRERMRWDLPEILY
jgi:hypothetical protein